MREPKDKSMTARQMAHKRWAGVPAEEHRRLLQEWGKKGGRPKSTRRCFCGAHTMERAMSRAFDCCREAGILKLTSKAINLIHKRLAEQK